MRDPAVRWLYIVPGSRKLYIAILTIVQALYGVTGVFYAFFLRKIVDSAVEHDQRGFGYGMIQIILLVICQLALRAVIRWLTELSKAEFENCFKGRLMETLLTRDYQRVAAVHSGEWLNRLTNDTVVVAGGYVDIIPGFAEMVVKLIGALVMILILEPGFAVILIPGGAALVFFTWLFRKMLKSLHKNVQEADGRLRIFLQERIGSMLMIRSFASEEKTKADMEVKMHAHKDSRMKRQRFSNLCNIGFGAAMSGMYLLGAGWCGYGILMGTITFGTLTAITQLISQIQMPFANITGYLPRFYGMIASAERLMEAEKIPEDSTEILSVDQIGTFYQHMDRIGFRDLDFGYLPVSRYTECVSVETAADHLDMGKLHEENKAVVLKGLSFSLKKGECLAFTGQSGCGKSTVIKLLMCVYKPDKGSVYYEDDTGSEEMLTAAHRRLFAYVPQGNVLMNGTVRELVTFARPQDSHDEERLQLSLAIACADGFVSELKDGADTMLGERGMSLSEGQMQRLAIARAIFSGAPVLLLDEATSALDADTEKELLDNLQKLTDKTIIIVTHRNTALSICDRVIVFEQDGIREK